MKARKNLSGILPMILDAGSGHKPLNAPSTVIHIDKYPNRIPNFINATIEHLPLRNGIIKKVYASHVLEHSLEPRQALLEFRRVATSEVEIRVPNLCYQHTEQNDHYYTWTAYTIYNLMKTVFPEVEVKHNFRIMGGDLIDHLRIQGLIRLIRWITKFETIVIGRPTLRKTK